MLDWLSNLVAPLNVVLFTMGGDAVTWAELLGFATGAACVALTVANRIENFPVGIANSAFFLVLFASARLWADSGLQIVYIVLGFVGWWQWVYGGERHTPLRTRNATRNQLVGCFAWVVVGTVGLTFFLRWADDAAPFWDALTTALSLAAQYLLNSRRVQTWWFWIAADVIYVPLYFTRDLNLTGIVYILFLGLAIAGYVQWRRTQRAEPVTAPPAVTTVAP
ncbi:nicotinamide riboside transporter PnuC [Jatrophihabitans sp. YIM 134969]